MGVSLNAVVTSVAACGVLLLAGCSSGATVSTPSVATSAAVPDMSSAAPAPMSSAPAEAPAAVVLATWTCAKDGEEITCICEGSEADCKSTVAEPSKVKGATGIVKWFNDAKGYGFIAADNGMNVFVRSSEVQDAGLNYLEDGQRIQFDFEDRGGKVSAVNLRVVDLPSR